MVPLYAASQWATKYILARFNREAHQRREARAASNIPSPEIWSCPNWSFITDSKVDLPRQPSLDRDQLDWYVSLPCPPASDRRLTPRLRAPQQVKPLSKQCLPLLDSGPAPSGTGVGRRASVRPSSTLALPQPSLPSFSLLSLLSEGASATRTRHPSRSHTLVRHIPRKR